MNTATLAYIVAAWLAVNLLFLLLAVRRAAQRRAPAWWPDDPFSRTIGVHVWLATPGLNLQDRGTAQYVRAWGEVMEDHFFDVMDRWRDDARREAALTRHSRGVEP